MPVAHNVEELERFLDENERRKESQKRLKEIKENSKDQVITEFLIDLVYTEAEHAGQWWWKETYKRKIKEYFEKWCTNAD